MAILEIEHKVKEKELMIREIEFEKMKIELHNAQVMAASIDFLIENGHIIDEGKYEEIKNRNIL